MEYLNKHPTFLEYLNIIKKSKQYVIKDGHFESHSHRVKLPKTIAIQDRIDELSNIRRSDTRKVFEIREKMIISEDHLKFKILTI